MTTSAARSAAANSSSEFFIFLNVARYALHVVRLDFPNKTQVPSFQGLIPWIPSGRAYLAAMLPHKLRGLQFANELLCRTADGIVMDFHRAHNAVRVNDKGTAKREPFIFNVIE